MLVYSYHEVTCRLEYTEMNGDLLPLIGRGCDGNSIHGIMSCICKSVFQALIKFKLASEWNFRDSWAASWCISILQHNIYFLIAQNSTHLQRLQIYIAGIITCYNGDSHNTYMHRTVIKQKRNERTQ